MSTQRPPVACEKTHSWAGGSSASYSVTHRSIWGLVKLMVLLGQAKFSWPHLPKKGSSSSSKGTYTNVVRVGGWALSFSDLNGGTP